MSRFNNNPEGFPELAKALEKYQFDNNLLLHTVLTCFDAIQDSLVNREDPMPYIERGRSACQELQKKYISTL